MKARVGSILTLVLLASLLVGGCKKDTAGTGSLGDKKDMAAGVKWGVPSRWTAGAEKPMRVTTYVIPAVSGDAEGGECAVFYFGPGEGGNVEGNIERWIGQFEQGATSSTSVKEVKDLKVHIIQVAGSYLAPAGMMMQSTGKKDNYRLLGAIVEGPQGSVFFKFTGPAKTVADAEGDFNAMVESLSRD